MEKLKAFVAMDEGQLAALAERTAASKLRHEEPENEGVDLNTAKEVMRSLIENPVDVSRIIPDRK